MKKIIVISGKQYSGKDTLAKILLDKFKTFKRIGIGDAIKIMYSKQTGLTLDEIEKNKSNYRTNLIELGNWGRKQNPDFWLNEILNMENDIIVPDLRLQHELDIFSANKAYLIRVDASFETRSKRGTITNADDVTEIELDNYSGWNYRVDNNSDIDNLLKKSEPLILDIKKYFCI